MKFFTSKTKLAKLEAEKLEYKNRLDALAKAVAPLLAAAAEKDGDNDKDKKDDDSDEDKDKKGQEGEDDKKDGDEKKEDAEDSEEEDEDNSDKEDEDEDKDEDEDMTDKEKEKAASLPPLKAAQYRASCYKTRLAAARTKFDAKVEARVTELDAKRQVKFDEKVSARAQQLFAKQTGAPLKANPSNRADGGADKTNQNALKGRAATVAAIKAERTGRVD